LNQHAPVDLSKSCLILTVFGLTLLVGALVVVYLFARVISMGLSQ